MSENTVVILGNIVAVVLWVFGAAAIFIAILLFLNRKEEKIALLVSELVCTVVVGICLLLQPLLDARLDSFKEARTQADEQTIGTLSNRLQQAEAALNKTPKQKLLDCLNSINPEILARLKMGQMQFSNIPVGAEDFGILQKLAYTPQSAPFIRLGHAGLVNFGRGEMYEANFILNPELLK